MGLEGEWIGRLQCNQNSTSCSHSPATLTWLVSVQVVWLLAVSILHAPHLIPWPAAVGVVDAHMQN